MTYTYSRTVSALALAIFTTMLLAGCGGGGGGSSSSGGTGGNTGNTGGSTPQATTATINGVLQDKATGILLAGRTVAVQGTSLSGTTDSNGAFTIANVPITTITLTIVDAAGASDGSYSVNLNSIGGSPRSLGTIQLTVSGNTPPTAPVIGG